MRDIFVLSFLFCNNAVDIILNKEIDFSMISFNLGLFLCYFLISQLCYNYSKSEIHKYLLLSVLLFVNTIFILLIIKEFTTSPFGHSIKTPIGWNTNSGPYAIFLASLVPILIQHTWRSWIDKKKILILSIISLSFLFLMLIILNSRSAFLGLAIGGMFFVLHKYKRKGLNYFIFTFFFTLIIILYNIRPNSADGRVIIWKTTLNIINYSPWFGQGDNSLPSLLVKYQGDYLNKYGTQNDKFLAGESYFAFNDILQITVEKGIIGTFLFLLLFFYILKINKSSDRFIIITIFVILGAGLTSYPLYTLPILIFLFALLGLLEQKNTIAIRVPKSIYLSILFLLCILFTFKYISLSRSYYLWNSNPNNLNHLQSLYPNLKNDDHYLYTLSKLYHINNNLQKAEKLLLEATKIKFDKEYYYELAKIYEQSGNIIQALNSIKYVESGIPTLIKPKYEIALLYLKMNDITNFKIKANEVISNKLKIGNSYSHGLQKKMKFLLDNID